MKAVLSGLLLAGALGAGFEQGFPNLEVPSSLSSGVGVFDLQHRLWTGFNGANFGIGLRYSVLSGFEVDAAFAKYMRSPRDNARDEYALGAGYTARLPHVLRARLDARFFSYQRPDYTVRRQNLFLLAAVQSEPLVGIVTPAVNVGYDGYERRLGFGGGVNLGLDFNAGPLRRINLSGEYWPVFQRNERLGAADCFTAALTLETYGHHFAFTAGNGIEMGPRRMMLGTQDEKVKFGFNIRRFLDVKTL